MENKQEASVAESPKATIERLAKAYVEYEKGFCDRYEQLMREGKVAIDDYFYQLIGQQLYPGEYAYDRMREQNALPDDLREAAEKKMPQNYQLDDVREFVMQTMGFNEEDLYDDGTSGDKSPSDGESLANGRDLELERVFREDCKKWRLCSSQEDHTAIFNTRTASQCIVESKKIPDPVFLWKSLWTEGEVCCLFADTNVGKSIYAVQIAEHVAKYRKVLYFDFEMSDKQFERRYTASDGTPYTFSPNFMRTSIDLTALDASQSLEDVIIPAIEQEATKNDARTLIIDNLTYLCNDNASGDLAGNLMMKLVDMKRRRGFSILVLAHTPKRALNSPLTQNDLAGSKKLINFFDGAFSIGCSANDTSMRYIKQIKARNSEHEYGADNVILCEITADDGWVHFAERGYASEKKLLKENEDKDEAALKKRLADMRSSGMSQREMARKTGLSLSKVNRMLAKIAISEPQS